MNERANILLVDDDRTAIAIMGRMLSELAQIRFATSGVEALRVAQQHVPDLVLLDVEMPEMNGFELCKAMKANPLLADVPIIFVTSHDSPEQEVAGLNVGAVDFISKPPRAPLVMARVRTHLRLKHMSDMLRLAAATDSLTGIANRRAFDETLAREWLRAQRATTPIALLFNDIDHFKAYNDRYGHQAGDRCLQAVARTMSQLARRPADLVARYGGEEFAVLLPETDARAARTAAQRLVHKVEALQIPHEASSIASTVTISVGVTAYDTASAVWVDTPASLRLESQRPRPPASALVAAADRALYAAKEAGRNRACFLALHALGSPDRALDVREMAEAHEVSSPPSQGSRG